MSGMNRMSPIARGNRSRFARSLALATLVGAALTLGGCHHASAEDGSDRPGKHRPGKHGKHKHGKTTATTGNRIPILSRIESGAKVDIRLGTTEVLLPTADTNADWPQAGNTPNKAYGPLALADAPERVWTASIAGTGKKQRLAASPVIGDGRLYAMDTDGVVHAFDAANGGEQWHRSFEIKGDNRQVAFGGGASFDSGKVYITTGTGDVAALDAKTGNQIWKVRPSGPLRGSPTVAFNAVFVMTMDNQIISLDSNDGKVMWTESASMTQAGVFGVAAPAAGQGTVIGGYSSGELVAYRYENGRQLWSDALARTSISTQVGALTDVDADPIITQGRVYALGQGGRMAAYELVTGQRIWELNLAGISTPAVAGDWIFTLTDEGKLLAIQRETGKVRWLTELQRYQNKKKKKGDIFWTGPVLAGGKLWVANTIGQVFTVNVSDGTPKLAWKMGSPVSLAPVVANKVLYILEDSGKISAYR
jgi:outer membrane protein assembly factor BamB